MRADQAAAALSHIGRKRGDIYQCRNLGIDARLSDGHATPAVTDKDDRTIGVRDDAIGCREIVLEDVRGSGTAMTRCPFASRSKITLSQLEAFAHAPCTRDDGDLLRAYAGRGGLW